MGGPLAIPFQILLAMAVAVFGIYLLIKLLVFLGWALGQLFGALGNGLGRLGDFIGGEVSDALRVVGGVITAALFVPLTVVNIVLGRWSRANHYGRALEQEAVGVVQAVYRIVLGHPTRLLGLTHLTDGVERRLPEAIRRAPGRDLPRGRSDAFEGYHVTGALPAGGSGARLYLAEPEEQKRRLLAAQGVALPQKVVIKSFSLSDGSTMPQIVRESRALHSARKLGLVLEHELTSTRFHYVMPYVPGDDLTSVTQQLHAEAGGKGLGDAQLRRVLGYTADLLRIMERFHAEGLWHKDIKPSNIIVSDGRVQLVDLGLITPLQSAMTLTTHGTEYFRDPELVRLALKGVKVNEVDGVKFDIYGAGAVLFSMIENSFPAHGSLSQITKRCPESVRWMIRRAMADMNKRYATSAEMLRDLQAVMAAPKLEAFPPASLPSMGGAPAQDKPGRKFFGLFAGVGSGGVNLDDLDEEASSELDDTFAGIKAEFGAAKDELADGLEQGTAAIEAAFKSTRRSRRERRREQRHAGEVAASGRSGRVRAGTFAGAGCFLVLLTMVCVGMFFMLSPMGAVSSEAHEPFDYRAGGSAQAGVPAPVPVKSPVQRHLDKLLGDAGLTTRPSSAAKQLQILATQLGTHRADDVPHRVLVLDDAPVSLRSTADLALAPTLSGLRAANFALVAAGLEHDLSDDEHARLESELRAVIGLGDPTDESVGTRVRDYLAAEPALDGVLWVGRGRGPNSVSLEFHAAPEQDHSDGRQVLSLAAKTF